MIVHWAIRAACIIFLTIAGLVSAFVIIPQPLSLAIDPWSDDPESALKFRRAHDFVVDLSETDAELREVAAGARSDQIVDWIVLGVLAHENLDAETLRDATLALDPYRDAALDEVSAREYGPARHVNLANSRVLLVVPARDPHPIATIGRLVDTARAELGEIPRSVQVFRYEHDPLSNTAKVEADHSWSTGSDYFTAKWGYHEATVSSKGSLQSFLGSIDSLTYVGATSPSSSIKHELKLGGRRYPDLRTEGVSLEDVAALYQAHTWIRESSQNVPVNSGTASGRFRAAFDEKAKPITSLMYIFKSDQVSDSVKQAFVELDQLVNITANDQAKIKALLTQMEELPEISLPVPPHSGVTTVESAEYRFMVLSVVAMLREGELRLQDEMNGLELADTIPSAPGFSLDPQWDNKGYAEDLQRLLDEPETLVWMAAQDHALAIAKDYPDDATPMLVHAAKSLSDWNGPPVARAMRLTSADRALVQRSIDGLSRSRGANATERALVPIFELKAHLRQRADGSSSLAQALLEYIEARNSMQCARYDGPLKGTHVGMVLFYTDVMAKIWESVDYHSSAPTVQVAGLLSEPRASVDMEPAWLEERLALPGTRVWFGPKPEALLALNEREWVFAPTFTRVYAAGSNPLNPGEESPAAEMPRRTIGWWNSHYEQLADYEPKYHAQNEIMKWSVITGLMEEHGTLDDLKSVEVNRSSTFDQWVQDHDELRYRQDMRLLPASKWIGGTECMERLQSYGFSSAGGTWGISGGVSLGSKRTLNSTPTLSTKVPSARRVAGVDYKASTPDRVQTLNGIARELPAATKAEASVVTRLPDAAVTRSGGTSTQARALTHTWRVGGSGVKLITKLGALPRGDITARVVGARVKITATPGPAMQMQRVIRDLTAEFVPQNTPLNTLVSHPHTRGRDVYLLVEGDTATALQLSRASDQPSGYLRAAPDSPFAAGGGGGEQPPIITGHSKFWEPDPSQGTSGHIFTVGEIDNVTARARIQNAGFMYLTPGTAGELFDDGSVARVFQRGLSARNAVKIKVDTQDDRLGQLTGYLGPDGTLVVQRPANLAPDVQQAFEDLPFDQALSGPTLKQMAAEVRSYGKKTLRLPGPRGPPTGQSAMDLLQGGDARLTLKELRAQHQAGNSALLDELLEAARSPKFSLPRTQDVTTNRRLRELIADVGHEPAQDASAIVLAKRQRDLKSAQELLGEISAQADTSHVRMVAIKLEFEGESDVSALLRASIGDGGTVPGFVRRNTTVEQVGDELRTFANLPTTGHRTIGNFTKPTQHRLVKIALENDVGIYLEHGGTLASSDLAFQPGQMLQSAIESGEYELVVLWARELGDFRPSVIRDTTNKSLGGLVRVDVPPAPGSGINKNYDGLENQDLDVTWALVRGAAVLAVRRTHNTTNPTEPCQPDDPREHCREHSSTLQTVSDPEADDRRYIFPPAPSIDEMIAIDEYRQANTRQVGQTETSRSASKTSKAAPPEVKGHTPRRPPTRTPPPVQDPRPPQGKRVQPDGKPKGPQGGQPGKQGKAGKASDPNNGPQKAAQGGVRR